MELQFRLNFDQINVVLYRCLHPQVTTHNIILTSILTNFTVSTPNPTATHLHLHQ